jgi:hypothetical protein
MSNSTGVESAGFVVRWKVVQSPGLDHPIYREEEAGPFETRAAAERFAVGLAATVGPALGKVSIKEVDR